MTSGGKGAGAGPTLRVGVAGSHSEICFQAHGKSSTNTSSVRARPIAITVMRCTGVSFSKRIVLNQKDGYNQSQV